MAAAIRDLDIWEHLETKKFFANNLVLQIIDLKKENRNDKRKK